MRHARARSLAFVVRASLRVAAVLLPAVLAAQAPIEDIAPPTITMPVTGGYTTASPVLTIQFADASIMDPNSLVTTVNGVAVTPPFSFVPRHNCPQTTCGWTAVSSGTIHLSPGSNTFHVELCDGEANCGAKDGHYTYTPPPPPQLLSVTPTYESIEAERSRSVVQTFTIANGSALSNVYTVTRTCTAALIASGCTPASTTRRLRPGSPIPRKSPLSRRPPRGRQGNSSSGLPSFRMRPCMTQAWSTSR